MTFSLPWAAQSCARRRQSRLPCPTPLRVHPPPGAGLSQEELMLKDECILVDDSDRITGHANKYNSHRRVGGRAREKGGGAARASRSQRTRTCALA